MTATAGADVAHAGTVGALGRDGDEHRLEDVVRLARSTGHQARSPERAKLTARAHADEHEILRGQRRLAPLGVPEKGVAAVDDDVTWIEQRRQLREHGVDRDAGFHHQDDLPRPRQRGHQLGQRRDR